MKALLIIFAIIFIIVKFWSNYLKNDLKANIQFHIKGGSFMLGLLIISEYVIGVIIIIKIILRLWK